LSVQALTWAWRQKVAGDSDLSASATKHVLVAMANWCREDWRAFASVKTLQEQTELGERTIRAAWKSLERQGLIQRVGWTGRTNRIPVWELIRQDSPDSNSAISATNPATSAPKSGNARRAQKEDPSLSREKSHGSSVRRVAEHFEGHEK